MGVAELAERMRGFMLAGYVAYLFTDDRPAAGGPVAADRLQATLGYALVDAGRNPPYLRHFLVCREHRGLGIGTRAFGLLVETLGASTVDIEVLVGNLAGRRFWGSLGFAERSVYMRLGG